MIWKESDYSKAVRKVPDMTMSTRCFLLYEGLLLQVHPERQSDLRSYHDLMARMAQKYDWSACEEYDQQVEGDGMGRHGPRALRRVRLSIHTGETGKG